MSKVDVVIGCFYGDEGKGKVIRKYTKFRKMLVDICGSLPMWG